MIPDTTSSDLTSPDEWSSRSSSIAHPFLEVYDEQQLMEQRAILKKRLQAARARESFRSQAARAHDYTDSVTNDASALNDDPYKLPNPQGPVSSSYTDFDHRLNSHSDDPRDYDDNPTSASSRLNLKTESVIFKPDQSISALFTSAEALAAANLLNPPPPPRKSNKSTSPPPVVNKKKQKISRSSNELSRMNSDQIELEHKGSSISRRSNRVNMNYGSIVTTNMPQNVPDHPYFSRFLKKQTADSTD